MSDAFVLIADARKFSTSDSVCVINLKQSKMNLLLSFLLMFSGVSLCMECAV